MVFQGSIYGAHANVIPSEGSDVPVVIWEIGPMDELSLDRYEGVAGGYYTKEYVNVEVDGEMKEALIYIMSPNDYGIPSDGYLEIIADGYKDFNFDIRILNDAVNDAHARTENRISKEELTYGNKIDALS